MSEIQKQGLPRSPADEGVPGLGKSAPVLGREIGKPEREMNVLLHRYGYLTGEPGAYSLTDKGEKYGTQEDHYRGNRPVPALLPPVDHNDMER
ncbi:hypothetical protein [Streptomyces sp. URMC 129]|uniref:hypothetical protein n=1 Tax=Streptomyces sp. URMC 129 TaxID=3423407 RepID=UPI003F1AAE96